MKRYFYVPLHDIDLAEGTVISSKQFVGDNGEPVNEFYNFGREGYFNLYINGVMQEGGMYQVEPNQIRLAAMGQSISSGTPIIIESVGFATEIE